MSYRGSMLLINDGKENEINWNKDKEREREREKIMTKRYVSMHTFVWIAFYKIYSVKSRLTFGYHFVNVVSAIWNGCVEASFPVGVVVDGANVAIGLNQRILTTHNITVAFFFLMFHIAGVWIVNAVFEGVSGMEILQGEQKSVMMTFFFCLYFLLTYSSWCWSWTVFTKPPPTVFTTPTGDAAMVGMPPAICGTAAA